MKLIFPVWSVLMVAMLPLIELGISLVALSISAEMPEASKKAFPP